MAQQTIIPMLAYEDGAAAIDWLVDAFGFTERTRIEEDGRIGHAELELNGNIVMLATPTPKYVAPRRHREQCEHARAWSEVPYVVDGVLVYVDDLAAHFERAKRAGATILSEPEDTEHGVCHYRAEDLEGHRWMFAEEI